MDDTTKVADTESFIHLCLEGFAKKESINVGIIWQDELVGVTGYHEIDWTNRMASIGYWLGEGFQGKGIMTKVVKALTDYAFDELQLNRVEIRAAVENKKSRAIPERLGFVNEGCLRQAQLLYDRYADLVVYGMLAEEWKNGG